MADTRDSELMRQLLCRGEQIASTQTKSETSVWWKDWHDWVMWRLVNGLVSAHIYAMTICSSPTEFTMTFGQQVWLKLSNPAFLLITGLQLPISESCLLATSASDGMLLMRASSASNGAGCGRLQSSVRRLHPGEAPIEDVARPGVAPSTIEFHKRCDATIPWIIMRSCAS